MRSAFCNRVPKGFLSYRFKQAIKMEAPCVFLRLIVIDPSRSPITTDPRWPEQQLLLVLPAWMWDHSPSFPNFWRLLIAFNDPKKIEKSDLPRSYIENPKPIKMMVLGQKPCFSLRNMFSPCFFSISSSKFHIENPPH